jgi:hypothetical protein
MLVCGPSTQEAEAGELQVPGQPGLFQKKEKKNMSKEKVHLNTR